MTPKTNFQHKVVSANERILPLQPRLVEWAKRQTYHFSFRTKGKENVCSDCGYTFMYDGTAKKFRCPHCGALLTIQDTRKRKEDYTNFFSTLEIFEGMQVQRVFQLDAYYCKGEKADYDIREVMRIWHDGKGTKAVTASTSNMFSYSYDSFSFNSAIELRKEKYEHNVIADCIVAPYAKILPDFRRMGVDVNLLRQFNPDTLLTQIVWNPKFETFIKSGNVRHLNYFLYNPSKLEEVWSAYRITLRRRYQIKDVKMWTELVCNLIYCGKDIHNAKYVCPESLKMAHAYWSDRKDKKKNEERRRRERAEAIRNEGIFAEQKSKFFPIHITDGLIDIRVISSVRGLQEEGEAMHHCVAGYWNKEASLILSARINGERIETIEVSLSSLEVVQSRGVCNKNTDYHDRIINLVNSNIDENSSRLTA